VLKFKGKFRHLKVNMLLLVRIYPSSFPLFTMDNM
jgi:hypothetical protein